MKIKIQVLPKDINQLGPTELVVLLKALEKTIVSALKEKRKLLVNSQRALKECLLLIYFLRKDRDNFEQLFQDLKKTEIKTGETAIKYFDLRILMPFDENQLKLALKTIDYDQLIRKYFKWQLLLNNLTVFKYDKALKQVMKSNLKIRPDQLHLILQILIDWTCRVEHRDTFIAAIKERIDDCKEDNVFWKSRECDLAAINMPLSKVKVMVWDTGVDARSIQGVAQDLALNYNKFGKKTDKNLMPLKGFRKKDFQLYKGWNDLKAGKEGESVYSLLEKFSSYSKEALMNFAEIRDHLIIYTHGTQVASVVVEGNPAVEIVPLRVTFDPKLNEPDYYTLERARNEVEMYEEVFSFINQQKIRIVNISWVYSKEEFESSLLNNGITDEKERARQRDEIFELLKVGLYKGIKNNPNTLFFAGAGNNNQLIEEDGPIPASFNLPNLLTIGAVNRQGKRTYFTCTGARVQLYANGEQVSCLAPRGMSLTSSGTSFASPNVANLAAKLLAINPNLTAQEVKKLLLINADRTKDEHFLIIHPRKTMEQLLKKQAIAPQETEII